MMTPEGSFRFKVLRNPPYPPTEVKSNPNPKSYSVARKDRAQSKP